jgi:hypothetical protein
MAAECSETSARPEVGKPLQAAATAVKAKNIKDANAALKTAEAAKDRCPYENFIIEQMRAAIATASGDNGQAIRSYEAMLASGRLPQAEQTRTMEALAALNYQAKDYAKSISWTNKYFQAGGSSPQIKTMLAQSYYLSNDCANAVKIQQEQINTELKNERTPAEGTFQLLAACYSQMKDPANLFKAREQLVTYYPKKEYWVDLIKSVANRPTFSDRLSLDVARLDFALGTMSSDNRYMEMAQYALIAGSGGEARQVVDRGFASKILGTGQQAERHGRLRTMVTDSASREEKELADKVTEAQANLKNGDAIAAAAFGYVGYGHPDKAIPVMEQALAKAEFKRKEDAKLHLALAYVAAGQQAKAVPILQSVTGADGTADMARLWMLAIKQNPKIKLMP